VPSPFTRHVAARHRALHHIAPLAIVVTLTACSGSSSSGRSAAPSTAAASSGTGTSAPTTTHAPVTTIATPTTTATTTVPAAFTHLVATVTAADLPFTYHSGCPVAPGALRLLHLSYWGFDDRPHVGALVVDASVITQVVGVFETLFAAHFPIRRMQPVDAFGGSDPASMAADNTSGFNCRNAVASGPSRWSAHAYGEAIDVNPVENPYLEGGTVQPPAGGAFTDRGRVRPGMATPGTVVNRAFAAAGWLWGGRWAGAPDYQHFSKTGG
jgi:hypothetical protein